MEAADDVSYNEARHIPYPLADSPNGYWRAWCGLCREPLRVNARDVERAVCNSCSDLKCQSIDNVAKRTPRQAEAAAKQSGHGYNDRTGD